MITLTIFSPYVLLLKTQSDIPVGMKLGKNAKIICESLEKNFKPKFRSVDYFFFFFFILKCLLTDHVRLRNNIFNLSIDDRHFLPVIFR